MFGGLPLAPSVRAAVARRCGGACENCGLDWPWALYYTAGLMTLMKPDNFRPSQYGIIAATGISLLGPLLLGFFALALRQHLKR